MTTIPRVDHGWRLGTIVALAVASLALGACDEDDPPVVSQSAYDDEAAVLCAEFADDVIDPEPGVTDAGPDADRIDYLRSDFVPALRSIVQSLETFGYPADKAPTYGRASAVALNNLAQIEDDAPELVDRLAAETMTDDENPFVRLDEALVALDVPC